MRARARERGWVRTLQQPLDDLVLGDDVDVGAPAGQSVPVDGVQEGLRAGLEQVLGPEVGLPQALAGAVELGARGAADDEVLGEVDAADRVEAADERLAGALVDAGDHRRDEVRSEPPLVQRRRHEVRHRLRLDRPLLAQTVQVHLVAHELRPVGRVRY